MLEDTQGKGTSGVDSEYGTVGWTEGNDIVVQADFQSTNIPLFVITSDKYLGALKGFSYLFNKYWGRDQGVIVAGFQAPDFLLPDNFHFHSLGDMADYPVGKWSNALIKLLHDYSKVEVFGLMLEDYWISRPVDRNAISILYWYMKQFKYVLKMDLCADRLYAAGATDYDNCGHLDLMRSDPASQYHMSLMTGLWNRELMLRYLIPDESPWDVELQGTPRVREDAGEVLVLGTRQWPIRHILAHRRGDPSEMSLDGLKLNDIEYMQDNNLI